MKSGWILQNRNICNAAHTALQTKGFTLLEVLVALAVLSIALTSVYRLHGQTMTMSARTRFYHLAPMLAQAKLAEIEHQDIKNATDGSGDFGQEYPEYSWTVTIEDVDMEMFKDSKYHFVRIDVTIAQSETDTYDLRTYRFYVE